MKPSVFGLAGLSLIGLTVCFIYLTSQRDLDNTVFGSEPFVGQPVQIQKTPLAKTASHDWRVEEPKNLGRLKLSNFLERDMFEHSIRQQAPSQQEQLKWNPIEKKTEIASQLPAAEPTQPLTVKYNPIHISDNLPRPVEPRSYAQVQAQALALPALSTFDDFQFTDQIEELAGASPIRPRSRDCGTSIQNLNAEPKYDSVKSVGMSRQLTDRTSVGVEYVYKDGCFNNQIVASRSLNMPRNMPSDDGVNLRVNMRF